MSDLVGNLKDKFSHDVAHIFKESIMDMWLHQHSRGAEMTGQLRLYGKFEHLRYCTLDDRSIAVLIMCLHPKKISQIHT